MAVQWKEGDRVRVPEYVQEERGGQWWVIARIVEYTISTKLSGVKDWQRVGVITEAEFPEPADNYRAGGVQLLDYLPYLGDLGQ